METQAGKKKPEFILKYGGHSDSPECCAVEYAHVLRGLPKKAVALDDESPVLVGALIGFNDSFGMGTAADVERTKYAGQFVQRLAGSRGSIEIEVRRTDALDALAALKPNATYQEQYDAALAAAVASYKAITEKIRESEVELLERMFALTEKPAAEQA